MSSAGNADPPDGYPNRTQPLSLYRSSSENVTGSSSLNLRPSGTLSFPEVSFSSSAEVRDGALRSFPGPPTETPWNEATQAEHVKPIATAQGNRAATSSVFDVPFRSPRGFHIPNDNLQKALDAKPGSAASYWQYTLYRGPKGDNDRVKLHYCKNKEATEAVSQLFVNESVIGCDIEWSAQAKSSDSIKKNVSLVQIACEDRIALFHIARFPGTENIDDLVAPTFRQIMESPKITKAGVAIKGDCTRLKNFLGIHCQGLFELSYLHKLVNYCSGNIDKLDRRYVRLAEQVQEHLKLPLLKGSVQTSDWGQDLNYQQTQYAASDSYAGLQLFHVLEGKRQRFNPVPPRPAHAELNLAISLGDRVRPKQTVDYLDEGGGLNHSLSATSSETSVGQLAREYLLVSLNDSAQVKTKIATSPAVEGN